MKKSLSRILSIALLGLFVIGTSSQKAMAQDVTVSYQEFYDNLSPYGQWVYDPQYGNVWVPNEGGDFRPYGSRGHWVMTDYGNTWVSEDPWGWAVYHYGRWTYDPYYGWVWIPGYEWAPAWVSWRYGGGYSGWAPLGPGVSISIGYNCPESWWIFMEPTYMYERDCYRHWRGPSYNTTYIHQTTVINNYYVDNHTRVRYNYGPRREQIENYTHQPVQVYRVSNSSRAGAPSVSGQRVNIYRPEVNRNTVNTARPSNVVQAPRSISRTPQAATNVSPSRQPEFRQHMQNNPQPNRQEPQRNNQVNRQEPQRQNETRQQPQPQRQPDNRPQPQVNPQRQPDNRQQQQQQRQQEYNRPQQQPQPQRQQEYNRPQQQPQPQRQPEYNRPQQQPQPQRQPENRPQQQPQRQPEYNRPQQQPQRQQEYNRPQPQPQQHQQPAPQQRSQPAPQQAPQRQAPGNRTEHERR